jgi:hypothetical protein
MFLDETYLGLRNKRVEGAEVFSDLDLLNICPDIG